MSYIVPRPPAGSHPLAQWMRNVCKCLESLRPLESKDTRVEVTSRGTFRSARPQRGGGGTGSGPAYYA